MATKPTTIKMSWAEAMTIARTLNLVLEEPALQDAALALTNQWDVLAMMAIIRNVRNMVCANYAKSGMDETSPVKVRIKFNLEAAAAILWLQHTGLLTAATYDSWTRATASKVCTQLHQGIA